MQIRSNFNNLQLIIVNSAWNVRIRSFCGSHFPEVAPKKTLITETFYVVKSLKVFRFCVDCEPKKFKNLQIFRRGNLSTYLPPKSCIPSKADITINRNNKNKRLIIDFMAFMSDVTKLRKDDQYLKHRRTSHFLESIEEQKKVNKKYFTAKS